MSFTLEGPLAKRLPSIYNSDKRDVTHHDFTDKFEHNTFRSTIWRHSNSCYYFDPKALDDALKIVRELLHNEVEFYEMSSHLGSQGAVTLSPSPIDLEETNA